MQIAVQRGRGTERRQRATQGLGDLGLEPRWRGVIGDGLAPDRLGEVGGLGVDVLKNARDDRGFVGEYGGHENLQPGLAGRRVRRWRASLTEW